MRRGAPPAAAWAALALALACNRDPHGMLRQPKARPFAPSPVFEDGRSMRRPPEGTVAREAPDLPDDVRTGARDGEPVKELPVPVTRALLARGRHDFQIWCAACHGYLGDGRSVPAEKMALRPPPPISERPMPPGHVFQVITTGYGLMPSYAEELSPVERWGVVAYLEALRRSQHASIAEVPEDVRRLLERAP